MFNKIYTQFLIYDKLLNGVSMELLGKNKEIGDIRKLTIPSLEKLSKEVNEFIISSVSETGGHLASNLGTTDLIVALLKVFNFEKDKIVFDVGHQSYAYKILTGRKEEFKTLRKYNGLSGFPKRRESKYDFFDTGHSSNSISAALGIARARDLDKDKYHVIALIGDGAMTGGEAFEGLNDLGSSKTNMLVILNDNGESISSSVGGLAQKLEKIRINPTYLNLKKDIKKRFVTKEKTIFVLTKIKKKIRNIILPPRLFENFGLKYFGPIDGHNIKELVETLAKIKKMSGPILLHVITKKGNGYLPAMTEPSVYHGVSSFDPEVGIESKGKDYSYYFGQVLIKQTLKNKKIVAITAAMKDGTGLTEYAEKFPDNFFDVGIAEGHAVSMAAGLASNGYHPVVAIYSTFLQRAYDQILIDVCMQDLPVTLAIDRAGLVGADGETHQGIFDISYLSHMPNMQIIAPKNVEELEAVFEYALNESHPVAIRYPRGKSKLDLKPLAKLNKGKWETIKEGKKVALIATGKMLELAVKISEKYPDLMLINATFIKPIDKTLLKKLSIDNYQIITLEDNEINGGLGSNILLYLNSIGYKKNIKIIGYDDKFISQGSIDELLLENNITIKSVSKIVDEFYK